MKHFLGIVVICMLFLVSACGGAGSSSSSKPQFLTIATASTGGTFYPIGIGLGQLWTEKLEDQGIKATGQSSAGSVENIDLLRNGEAQLAILQGIVGPMAYEGIGEFEGNKYEDLRSISMLWPNVEHFVLKESNVKTGTISDIEGMKYSIGARASGTEMSSNAIFAGLGYGEGDIKLDYLGFSESASSIKDGRLDGAALPGGIPVSAVTDLYASNSGTTILEVTAEQLDQINNKYDIFFPYEIPAGSYPGQDNPIQTIAQPNWLGLSKELDEELVYKLTQSLFENLDYMYGIHESAKEIKLETALDGLPAPLHVGAYKYFKEVGLEIPENLIPPEAN